MGTTKAEQLSILREACENDLLQFIRTVIPNRVLGHVHEEVISWWQRHGAKPNSIVLLPRGHQKSFLIAARAAQWLTNHPSESILYTSATAGLSQLQLYAIKEIITSKAYRRLWPDMVNIEESKRSQWNKDAITVDHPKRKIEGTRDPSVLAIGVGGSTTGRHAGLIIFDDLVVPENAYTEEGRRSVAAAYAQFASIANPGAEEWVVGTRYDPNDLYGHLMDMTATRYDDFGEEEESWPLYDVFTRVVEEDGEFVWPRQKRSDGNWYGFDAGILARIKAKYSLDPTQFYAQYYNDPNDPENQKIDRNDIQYYERKNVTRDGRNWLVNGKRVNIIASMDFAYSMSKRADYSAIAVVGLDEDGKYYVLDLDRFKTDEIPVYFERLMKLYNKWEFNKVRMEVVAAQQAIVRQLKDNFIIRHGIPLAVDEFRPTRADGPKEERMAATLLPLFHNNVMHLYKGGHCQTLEEEIISARPAHDDLADAVTAAVDALKPPLKSRKKSTTSNVIFNTRFGGISY